MGVRICIGAGSTAVVVAALAAVRMTPIEVRGVGVTGASHMANAEVARLTGVTPGTSLTWAQARRVEEAMRNHPAFRGVVVTRGFTGILHVRVVEREPAAWMPEFACAVSEDGVLLRHLGRRDREWVAVDGFRAVKGTVVERDELAEALRLAGMVSELETGDPGLVRRLAGGGWEWIVAGKRVRLSSPPAESELARLRRFREEFPTAWGRASRVDLRFRDRVVVGP